MAQMPGHPLYFPPVPDPQLRTKIVNQIDYYFRYFFHCWVFLIEVIKANSVSFIIVVNLTAIILLLDAFAVMTI